MEALYTEIEIQVVANDGLKAQVDLLKDIVVQLPDVKNNQQIQQRIGELFKQYDSSR